MTDSSATASPADGPFRRLRKNAFLLGVLNGSLFQMGFSFIDPSTVLPAFVNELTRSGLAVGVVAALDGAGWLLPQLVVANYVQVMPRKLPVYRAAAATRLVSLAALIVSLYALGGRPRLLLGAFLLFYAMTTFSGGAGGVSFIDVVAKTVSPYRIGSFFGQRQMFGGILGLASAVIVRQVLREGSPAAFPHNYAYLFILGTALMAAGIACFWIIDEPAGPVEKTRPPLREFLRRAPAVLKRDADFRWLFAVRLVAGMAAIASPFYVVFARSALGMPASMLGIYLGAQTIGGIVSNLVWAPISNRYGGRRTVVAVAFIGLFVPALAAALAVLPLSRVAAGWGVCVVFLLVGSAASGSFVAYNHYLLEVAPEVMRPTYVGVINTFSGIITIMPIVGGALLAVLSYGGVFAIAAAASLAGLLMATRLRDLRDGAAERFGQRPHPQAGGGGAAPEI